MPNDYAAPLHVVLVEDDEIDAEAVTRLLHKQPLAFELTVFPNGRAAQDALGGPFGAHLRTRRHLFLLDLDLPRLHGLELLAWLRREPAFQLAIVFVLSASETDADLDSAYHYHIAGYLPKAKLGAGYAELAPLLTSYRESVAFPPA